MKEKWQKIYNIVSLVLLVICFIRIGWLQGDIRNLQNAVNNNRSMLQSSIDAISSNVRYEMEQAANLLSDSSWNTGSLNIEDQTATLYCYVVPKVYNPEKTVATIICNGKEIPMTLESGKYTAEITMPLFEESTVTDVQFEEEGTIRTQQLDWLINPRYDMVPTAYVYYSGASRQNHEGPEKITKTYSGAVEIDFEHKGLFVDGLKEATVVLLVNDEEVWTYNPVLEELHTDDYITHYQGNIEHSFDIKRGDTVKMYAELVDINGWKYHSVLEDVTISEKGNPLSNGDYHSEAEIYDADGNLLFQPDY